MSSAQLGAALLVTGLLVTAFFFARKPKSARVLLVNSAERHKLALISKESVSHDTRRFRFKVPDNLYFGLPIGKHIFVSYTDDDGKLVSRAYTPTSLDSDGAGFFELLVKVYAPNPPRFPNGGKVSQYLDSLNIGDLVTIRGPLGHIQYLGRGQWQCTRTPVTSKINKIAMVAGGTGVTPMFQVIRAINTDPSDTTTASFLFGNQTPDDVLLRPELDSLKESDPRISIHYTVDRVPPGANWGGNVGFVTEEMMRRCLPAPGVDTLVLLCGPPLMVDSVKKAALAIGHAENRVLSF